MIFISFCIIDYLFQGVLGFFNFFDYLHGKDTILFKLPEETDYLGLVSSALSIFFLLVMVPIWAIQIKNKFKAKTQHDKENFGRKRKDSDSIGEISDTGSMLLRPSSDWNPNSFTNQASFLLPKVFKHTESSCCYHRNYESTVGMSLAKT